MYSDDACAPGVANRGGYKDTSELRRCCGTGGERFVCATFVAPEMNSVRVYNIVVVL